MNTTAYPKQVKIIEVGPRDGLQNEKEIISLADKLRFIELLSEAGLPEIEAGSFVSPKWVPQMANSEAIFQHLKTTSSKTIYTALVPNEKGMESAVKVGVKKIAIFTAASESFNQKNINCSIEESINRFKPVIAQANQNGLAIRGYVSTAFVCPYEGAIQPQKVFDVVQRLVDLGITDISIGDTVGKANPRSVADLLNLLLKKFSPDFFAMHFHDTYGMAITNVYESLKFGIHQYDASAGGLGGCPYAPGASGNVATNDLVWFFDQMKIQTGINLQKLQEASLFIQSVLGRKLPSKVLQACARIG